MMLRKNHPTIFGYIALLIWALAAPFVVKIKALPVFEVLAIVFTISFILTATKLSISDSWGKLKQPPILWVVGFLGIYGNDLLYIEAFKHAPAAQADIINYLWPVLVILFTGLLPDEKLSFKHILSAALGFAGVYVLIHQKGQALDISYLPGYIFAFLDALVWSIYTVIARRFGNSPVDMIGIYGGIGALFSWFLHFKIETTIMPSMYEWPILIIMGATTQYLAYSLWDYGIKKGDLKTLTILSYGSPILSIFFLIAFGMASVSKELIIACFLVTTAGLVGLLPSEDNYFFKYLSLIKT